MVKVRRHGEEVSGRRAEASDDANSREEGIYELSSSNNVVFQMKHGIPGCFDT